LFVEQLVWALEFHAISALVVCGQSAARPEEKKQLIQSGNQTLAVSP
jgi:hypothetical protein